MKYIKKKLRYIYWLTGHQHYSKFGENGDNGVYVISIFLLSIIFFSLSLVRVILWENKDLTELFGINFKFFFKLFFVIIALLIYYIVRKQTREISIKNNLEFEWINNKKRIKDTIIFYIVWIISALGFLFLLALSK
ncbi:hypothetical protein EGI15_12560 [Chryseobacterium cucumeris]|uniref:Uncharacterized protein n=1 Tax=Chryseobacterium cucumeris TaxID=1813611 RepID=A0ABX9X7N1_9FLAO|nr:hypothetical protein [Chryseobacterium cucumeris]ROH91389.1 hypothetical protein EGI15_12560 [Chryseobacterium cucumeris]